VGARAARGAAPLSKAFTSEDDAGPAPVVPPRAPLPEGVPNYVTARGLARLHDERAALAAERAAAEREPEGAPRAQALAALAALRAQLEARIASAELVPPPDGATDVVRFGATVTVEGAAGARPPRARWQIVGVDEADPAAGRLAFVSPLARALLGRRVGDTVTLRTPRGEEELEILAVAYGEDPAAR
jgi:transcription elongation factor GreB